MRAEGPSKGDVCREEFLELLRSELEEDGAQ